MNFHEWLISQRKYCEVCNWGKGEAKEGTRVIKDEHGHEIVVCNEHAGIKTKEQTCANLRTKSKTKLIRENDKWAETIVKASEQGKNITVIDAS